MIRSLGSVLLLLSVLSLAQQSAPRKPLRLACPTVGNTALVKQVNPGYPKEALEKRIHGPVILDVVIDKAGAPRRIQVIKGDPILVTPAVDAVRQWRWASYKLNGKAVEVQTNVVVNFELPSTHNE